jgi:predicted Ser/Thr protein kinase
MVCASPCSPSTGNVGSEPISMRCPTCGDDHAAPAGDGACCGAAPEPLAPGAVVAGRYEVLRPLGSGGMGAVFAVRDRMLDETLALKLLRAPERAGAIERFRQEIKLAWRVRHRNVCGLREYGEEGGRAYITMELVEGRNLRQLLRERGALPWEEAFALAEQVAEGLAAVHEAGILHRDLKATNVMRDAAGVVRLMDFGIAEALAGAGLVEAVPVEVLGSLEYMSPEQVRGAALDERSDLYALGIVVFEIFTGRVPFRGDTPAATMLLKLEAETPFAGLSLERLPLSLRPVLARLLAKEPGERYASARDAVAALRRAAAAVDEDGTGGHAPVAGAAAPPEGSPAPELPPDAGLLVPSLVRALTHDQPRVRAEAVRALGVTGPAARPAVPDLLALRADPSPEVRRAVEEALDRLAPEERRRDGGEG